MEIKEIEIHTDDLKGTEDFYTNVLDFKLISKSKNTITFLAGNSRLTFLKSHNQNPNYHFAFNIPHNKLDSAIIWTRSKLTLLKNEENEIISNFESWNSKSIYFYDNNKNVLEFIARYDLENEIKKEFDSSSIIAISEIGIVTEEPMKFASQIIKSNNLNFFEKGKQSEQFVSLGNDEGLLIIVKNERKWFPTELKAEPNFTRIKYIANGWTNEINIRTK
jgi:catechol-2,3-dioxygenase